MNIVGSGSSPVFGRQILDIGNEFDSPLSLIKLFFSKKKDENYIPILNPSLRQVKRGGLWLEIVYLAVLTSLS